MPTRNLLFSENNYQSQSASSVPRPCTECSKRTTSLHIQPINSEEGRLIFAVMEAQKRCTEKAVSNGVCIQGPTPHQKDFCNAKGEDAACSEEVSSYQIAVLYLRSMKNELEYDTRVFERMRDDCVAYIHSYFEDLLAVFTQSSSVNNVSIISLNNHCLTIVICRMRKMWGASMFESIASTWHGHLIFH